MKLRYLPLLCSACMFAGCGGGGGTQAVPVSSPAPPPLVVTPSQLAFTASGATQTFAAREGTITGQFSSATAGPASCANVASVAPTAGTTNSYTVTAGNTVGTCSITVKDGNNQSVTVTVTVTFTQGSIQ